MRVLLMVVLLLGPLVRAAPAQDTRLLDCLDVSVFGQGCPPAPVPVPEGPSRPTLADYPLFPPSTLAPDTPPVFVQLLEDLTPETADLFLEWHAQRHARVQAVQQLLKQRAQVRHRQPLRKEYAE